LIIPFAPLLANEFLEVHLVKSFYYLYSDNVPFWAKFGLKALCLHPRWLAAREDLTLLEESIVMSETLGAKMNTGTGQINLTKPGAETTEAASPIQTPFLPKTASTAKVGTDNYKPVICSPTPCLGARQSLNAFFRYLIIILNQK
jgi:hypothetical protein